MKTLTMDLIRSFEPCYDPIKYASEDWTGTALDVLKHPDIPAEDKLWLVLREECLDSKALRLFAVACARSVLTSDSDPRSIEACNVAEKYASGLATDQELAAAESAAWYAAYSAASSAAESAASSAAESAAESAAYSAAESAAESAAYSAARSAARYSQVNILINILTDLVVCKNKEGSKWKTL